VARILIVEDEDPLRSIMRRLILRGGHEPVEAPDLETAVRLLAASPFDLILSDIHLPGLDAGNFPGPLAGFALPIIAVTGAAGALGAPEDLAGIGVVALVEKPFPVGDLLEAVEMALKGRSNGERTG